MNTNRAVHVSFTSSDYNFLSNKTIIPLEVSGTMTMSMVTYCKAEIPTALYFVIIIKLIPASLVVLADR